MATGVFLANATISGNFGEPRSPNTLLQLKAANRVHNQSRGFLHRIPALEPWSVQVATDWGNDGKRLEAQVWNFCGRKKNAAVWELSHDVPAFDIGAAARLFESNLRLALPNTVFLCVVDPGVGSERKAIAVETGNRAFFVGPHNGVFDLVLRGLNSLYGIVKAVEIDRASTHVISQSDGGVRAVDGDAVFAPVAGAIVKNRGIPSDLGREIPLLEFGEVLKWDSAVAGKNGAIQGKIEDIDHYGTFVTNIPVSLLNGNGKPGSIISVCGAQSKVEFAIPYFEYFDAVGKGEPLMLPQGNAFLHLAVNQGRASDKLPLKLGEGIFLASPN